MRPKRKSLFILGSVFYACSFFLRVEDLHLLSEGYFDHTGWHYAYVFLINSWKNMADIHGARDVILFVVSVLIGWSNPLFLISLILLRNEKYSHAGSLLRRIVLAILVLSGWFFYDSKVLPREGYALWVLGMVLMLFSIRGRLGPSPISSRNAQKENGR